MPWECVFWAASVGVNSSRCGRFGDRMRNESAPGVKTQNESKTVVVTWLARTSCNWRYHFSRHPANPLSSTVTPVLLRIEGLSPRKARVRVGRRRNLAGKKKLRGELSILTRNGGRANRNPRCETPIVGNLLVVVNGCSRPGLDTMTTHRGIAVGVLNRRPGRDRHRPGGGRKGLFSELEGSSVISLARSRQ